MMHTLRQYFEGKAPTPESFRIKNVEFLGRNAYFCKPLFSGIKWDQDLVFYRSRIEDENGRILSLGFPKFFNLGERLSDEPILNAALQDGTALFLDKLDGTLAIRDELDGMVSIRTRGSHQIGVPTLLEGQEEEEDSHSFDSAAAGEMLGIFGDYGLLDPIGAEGVSYLFEYTSPRNKIVVSYDKPSITLLGAVRHADLTVLRPDQFSICVNESGPDAAFLGKLFGSIPRPRVFTMSSPDLLEVRRVVNEETNEGVVAWCGQTLVKIKSDEYLRIFRAMYGSSTRDLIALALTADGRVPEAGTEYATWLQRKNEFPEEMVPRIEPAVESLVETVESTVDRMSQARKFVRANWAGDRKAFAQKATSEAKDLCGFIFAELDGKLLPTAARSLLKEVGLECRDAELVAAALRIIDAKEAKTT